MSATGIHYLARGIDATNHWIAQPANSVETDDRAVAYRVLRACLHCVRDGPTVEGSARLAPQPPEPLRSVYDTSRPPSKISIGRGHRGFADAFAVTAHVSTGMLDHALAGLPQTSVGCWGWEAHDDR